MASDPGFVEYICEQLRDVGGISYRKMFGEYAVYVGTKVVALVCDNQLFLKPTAAGRALLANPVEAPPYPGARPHLLLDAELEDRDLMAALFRTTEREVAEPKPRKRKRPSERE
jgi:TfoX/Sxy family transcriptional regulator of competence genes